MDAPAIMSIFSVFIRDALTLFPDIDNFRPAVRRATPSLKELNKQMFTIYLSETEKKSILLNPGETLYIILEKICQTRGIALETIIVLDGNRNPLPSLQIPLSSVEGRCAYLSHSEIKTKPSSELPRINEFIFPLPSSTENIQKSLHVDLHEVKNNYRKSLSKSISSSLIPRALSPRQDSGNMETVSAGNTPREDGATPATGLSSYNFMGRSDKRKSMKYQLTKRASEINTKTLQPSNRTKSDMQVPLVQSNSGNPPHLSQTMRAKSELQFPTLLSSSTQSFDLPTHHETKKARTRSIRKGKENIVQL